MSIPAAYISVILIWSTTPLAIQWSSVGWGFLFGATGRMCIGLLLCLIMLLALNNKLPWHRQARRTYAAAGLGIYGAMISVYWGAQFIPSGLVATVFGLTPVVTGALAALVLREAITVARISGALLGLLGLMIIFNADLGIGQDSWKGIVGILLAVSLHAASAIWMKKLATPLHPLSITTGGLLVAVPMYILTWLLVDGKFPVDQLTSPAVLKPGLSMTYLAVFGSVLGFSLYFYVLKHVEANKVALITLVTPVLALLWGHWINSEPVLLSVWSGAACIIFALSVYQWGDVVLQTLRGKLAVNPRW